MSKEAFYKEYTKIVIPLLLQAFITTLVAVVDNLMVGQLGDTAIAAVALSNRILGIIIFTLFGVSAASSVFIAQYFGAKNIHKQKEAFRVGIIISIVILFLFSASFYLFPRHIVHFFTQDNRIGQFVIEYTNIMLIGCIPYLLSINYFSASKVIGQVKLPLVASLAGVAVNTTLNYFLIFGHFGFPRLGIAGAAIATVISRIVEFLIMYLAVLYYRFDFNTKLTELFSVSPQLFKEVSSKALPLAINEIIWAFGQATILKIYGVRGADVIAAYAINDTTSSIFFSFIKGISGATPVLISQRLGAGKLKEAYWNAKMMMKTAGIVAVFLGVVMFGTSFVIPNLYHVSTSSHQLAVDMIQISAVLFWIFLLNTQIYFIMRAGGDMTSTLVMDGLFYWTVTIPVLALTTYLTNLPIVLIYIIGQGCELIKLGISSVFFLKKKWLRNLTTSQ